MLVSELVEKLQQMPPGERVRFGELELEVEETDTGPHPFVLDTEVRTVRRDDRGVVIE